MNQTQNFFATVPLLMEALLADELRQLGASGVRERRAGVEFSGSMEIALRACLWSRLANRILLPLADFEAGTATQLYAGVQEIDWRGHLGPEATLAVEANGQSGEIRHSKFAALKVKDAIADQLRETTGSRPNVSVQRPDVRINLYLHRGRARLSLDLSGDSLHRRGYRRGAGNAPLKENLAAAILIRTGWPELAAAGAPLLDPMCGSATLPIEAAMMAADIAPGLLRDYFGFSGWRGHDADLWQRLRDEARARRGAGLERLPRILGFDADLHSVRQALENIDRAGLQGHVHVERRTLEKLAGFRGLPEAGHGLLICNPPYGERLGDKEGAAELYARLGERMRQCFQGWRAGIIIADAELGFRLGLRARHTTRLYNGAIECRLLDIDIETGQFLKPRKHIGSGETLYSGKRSPGADMFANRLRKNLRQLGRWAQRNDIGCYRLYDADMPEYALAIDLYRQADTRENSLWVQVQEYAPPPSIDSGAAGHRLREAVAVIAEVLELDPAHIFLKVRERQKGKSQYQRQAREGRFIVVREGPCQLLVNLADYLDTGLFPDHRLTRGMLGEMAAGRRFLNLFCYTGAATVHAALGGARETVSVDMSRTYLDWAARNLALNHIRPGQRHRLIQADCLEWLRQQAGEDTGAYDLIFLDPPSFSNSKRMRETLDIQRDHVRLIREACRLLSTQGTLIFSTNQRKFTLDSEALADLDPEDLTRQTTSRDFQRRLGHHRCWAIRTTLV